MRTVLPAGILPVAFLLGFGAASSAAFAETVDEDLVPGGKVYSTIFPSTETEVFRVAAPAGSLLSVDLGPAKKGSFAPVLLATLSDGSGAALPPLGKSGKTKAVLAFPVDGTLELRVLSGRGGSGDYLLRTKLKVPRGPDLEGIIAGPEGVSFEFAAPAGSVATVSVKTYGASDLIPKIQSLAGPGGPVTAGKRRADLRYDRWLSVPQPSVGPWTLTVVGNIQTLGPFTGAIRWKSPHGPNLDHRGVSDPAALAGDYASLLATADASSGGLPALLTGGLVFDGKGRIREELSVRSIAADAASPLGFGLAAIPVEARAGSYYTDGTGATVNLDLGGNQTRTGDFAVAAGGSFLYSGIGTETSASPGLLLARTPVPTKAELAGSWLYVNAATTEGGDSSVEIGTLSLGDNGTVSGFGARTALTLEGGVPTPGDQTPVLRTGSFSVGADGVVTLVTVPNIVGAPESWTSSTVFRADILAGLDAGGGGGRVLLRQGIGLGAADVAGNYVHFGLDFGAALGLRSGILAFDGVGAFGGSETRTDLAGTTPPAVFPVTGTYSVNAQGIANFNYDGGAQGTGIVGPEGTYLFTVSFGAGGVGVDLLLDLE